MKYLFTIFTYIILLSCSDSSSPVNHILTIDNDLSVQVKFYVDSNLKLRIDGESLETLELLEGEYKFSISSPSFIDCNPYDPLLCTPVFSSSSSETDTTLFFDRNMQALIRINAIDQLIDAEIYNIDFIIK